MAIVSGEYGFIGFDRPRKILLMMTSRHEVSSLIQLKITEFAINVMNG